MVSQFNPLNSLNLFRPRAERNDCDQYVRIAQRWIPGRGRYAGLFPGEEPYVSVVDRPEMQDFRIHSYDDDEAIEIPYSQRDCIDHIVEVLTSAGWRIQRRTMTPLSPHPLWCPGGVLIT